MNKQNNPKCPFLWNFIITEKIKLTVTGGQERPMTKTIAEESSSTFIEIE